MNHLKVLVDATKRGLCLHLVYDDNGHWAVSDASMGACGPNPEVIVVSIDRGAWKRTPEKAIEYWAKQRGEKA